MVLSSITKSLFFFFFPQYVSSAFQSLIIHLLFWLSTGLASGSLSYRWPCQCQKTFAWHGYCWVPGSLMFYPSVHEVIDFLVELGHQVPEDLLFFFLGNSWIPNRSKPCIYSITNGLIDLLIKSVLMSFFGRAAKCFFTDDNYIGLQNRSATVDHSAVHVGWRLSGHPNVWRKLYLRGPWVIQY